MIFFRTTVTEDDLALRLQFIVHWALDPLEEAITARRRFPNVDNRNFFYYGLVFPNDEHLAWAWAGASKMKIILVTDETVLCDLNADASIREMLSKVHDGLSSALCNPFYSGGEITSVRFNDLVSELMGSQTTA